MYERGERVVVEGHRGQRAVLRVWEDRGRGLTLSTEDGYRRLLAGDVEAPQVGFPLRDVRERVPPTTSNRRAKATVDIIDGTPPDKDPERVARGKLGGAKGGKLRAEKLSPERRAEIARKAAEARWSRVGWHLGLLHGVKR